MPNILLLVVLLVGVASIVLGAYVSNWPLQVIGALMVLAGMIWCGIDESRPRMKDDP